MSDPVDPDPLDDDPDALELLVDEHARAILAATSEATLSAGELAERCDVSRQTVYRRLERLDAAGLVAERTRPREDGGHETVYAATFERATVELDGGSIAVDVERREPDPTDELYRLWGDL